MGGKNGVERLGGKNEKEERQGRMRRVKNEKEEWGGRMWRKNKMREWEGRGGKEE